MTIILNGEPVPLDGAVTVADLIAARYADGRGLAVAVDRTVVPRAAWSSCALVAGQRVDVVTAVQGG